MTIATLRDLAAAIATEDVTVDDLVGGLGGEPVDMIGNVLVDEPSVSGVTRANVVRAIAGDAPAHVTLELAAPVSEEALAAAFGTPTAVSPEYAGAPDRLLYDLELPDGPYTVTLLASIEDGGTRRVTLRRDARLG